MLMPSDQLENPFQPPADWEAAYAADPGSYFFGEEPSQIARSAVKFFRMFGGEPAQAQALDLGCGEGRDTAFLAAAGFRVTARDLSPMGIEKLKRLVTQHAIPMERVDAEVSDVRTFDYPAEAFALTLAANVFQFLPPDEVPAQIQHLQSATQRGGICAVGVFSPAMRDWGAQIEGRFTATSEELARFFPAEGGWLLLDRTDYRTYRPENAMMASFSYIIARRLP